VNSVCVGLISNTAVLDMCGSSYRKLPLLWKAYVSSPSLKSIWSLFEWFSLCAENTRCLSEQFRSLTPAKHMAHVSYSK
jgi:hypothetical protein